MDMGLSRGSVWRGKTRLSRRRQRRAAWATRVSEISNWRRVNSLFLSLISASPALFACPSLPTLAYLPPSSPSPLPTSTFSAFIFTMYPSFSASACLSVSALSCLIPFPSSLPLLLCISPLSALLSPSAFLDSLSVSSSVCLSHYLPPFLPFASLPPFSIALPLPLLLSPPLSLLP